MFGFIRQRIRDARTLRHLFTLAEQQAHTQGQSQPAAEHIVLAALQLPNDTSATQALARVGIDEPSLRAAIERQYVTALQEVGLGVDDQALSDLAPEPIKKSAKGLYLSQPSARRLMQVLTQEIMIQAQASNPTAPLRAAHVLMAASSAQHGVVPRALKLLGVSSQQLSQAAHEVLA